MNAAEKAIACYLAGDLAGVQSVYADLASYVTSQADALDDTMLSYTSDEADTLVDADDVTVTFMQF